MFFIIIGSGEGSGLGESGYIRTDAEIELRGPFDTNEKAIEHLIEIGFLQEYCDKEAGEYTKFNDSLVARVVSLTDPSS